jgi:hypothetical protein
MLSPYFYADDRLRASFTMDLPESFLAKDTIVYQYVQLTPDNDPGSVYISITCSAVVDNDNSQKIVEHNGATRMDSTTMKGKKVYEQNQDEVNADSTFTANKDLTLYKAYASEISGNKVQPCIAELPISKKNPDESIYTTWRGVGGARIYKNDADTNPIEIPESEMTFVIEKPDMTQKIVDPKEFAVFDDFDFFDADELADAGIEMQPLDKLGGEFTLDKSVLGFDGKAVQSVLASFEVVDNLTDPDNINFLFMADIPRDAIYESAIIYQWAQLTPKEHSEIGDLSVDCKVQVGNPDGSSANVYKKKIEDS